jgi:hypothetical protein
MNAMQGAACIGNNNKKANVEHVGCERSTAAELDKPKKRFRTVNWPLCMISLHG